jgi:hypothetical protein
MKCQFVNALVLQPRLASHQEIKKKANVASYQELREGSEGAL